VIAAAVQQRGHSRQRERANEIAGKVQPLLPRLITGRPLDPDDLHCFNQNEPDRANVIVPERFAAKAFISSPGEKARNFGIYAEEQWNLKSVGCGRSIAPFQSICVAAWHGRV
jgi:hypothetical protein